jgi:hypothetical protein
MRCDETIEWRGDYRYADHTTSHVVGSSRANRQLPHLARLARFALSSVLRRSPCARGRCDLHTRAITRRRSRVCKATLGISEHQALLRSDALITVCSTRSKLSSHVRAAGWPRCRHPPAPRIACTACVRALRAPLITGRPNLPPSPSSPTPNSRKMGPLSRQIYGTTFGVQKRCVRAYLWIHR